MYPQYTCQDVTVVTSTGELHHFVPQTVLRHNLQVEEEAFFHRNLIEVGHDVIPMSGVAETSHAHKKGHTIDTCCAECNAVMFSVETASMVVCPFCRCVSPIETCSKKKFFPTNIIHAGIGLPIEYVLTLE